MLGMGACLHGLAHLEGNVVRVHSDLHHSAALVSNVQPRGAVWVGDLFPIPHIHGACQACIGIHKSQCAQSEEDARCTGMACSAKSCTARCIACVMKHRRLELPEQAICYSLL